VADTTIPQSQSRSPDVFKWVCLAVATMAAGWLGWVINDLRLELKKTAGTLNRELPKILANTKTITESMKDLSNDLKQLRELGGISGGAKDNSLVKYADDVLDLIQKQDAKIGKKKLLRDSLKDPLPAKEWVVGARREAIYHSFRVRSKREMLEKLTTTLTGGTWYIQFADEDPVPLLEWVKQNHPDSAKLFQPPKPKAGKTK